MRSGKYSIIANAFLVAAIFLIIAILRPLDFGNDTITYYITFIEYYDTGERIDRFPDLYFDLLSKFIVNNVRGQEEGFGILLIIIGLSQFVFFYKILAKQHNVFMIYVIGLSFGPLIFFDILRQGLAMVIVGYFYLYRSAIIFFIFSIGVHLNSLFALPILFGSNKLLSKKQISSLFVFSVVIVALLFEEIYGRLAWYLTHDGYLTSVIELNSLLDSWSAMNYLVVIFYIYIIKSFQIRTMEGVVLLVTYLSSIYYPLLHRIYIFILFLITINPEISISRMNKISSLVYCVIILKLFLNAFPYQS